jgi:hypothetical protein
MAPLSRNLTTSRNNMSDGVQPIGQLLSGVLARYGIVMTAAELAAFRIGTTKVSSKRRLNEQLSRHQPRREWPQRRARLNRAALKNTPIGQNKKMVQLPLFLSVDRRTINELTVG